MLSSHSDVPIFSEYRSPPGESDFETCEDEFLHENSATLTDKLDEVRDLIRQAISKDGELFTVK